MLEQEIILKHFPLHLACPDSDMQARSGYADFRQTLIDAIQYLLNHNIEQLSQAMYRIDVAENDFCEALYQQNATVLADLTIERVRKKIIFRQKYQHLADES